MAKTHFAAIHQGAVVGYRSSTSRHAEGHGRFGLYTHAVFVTSKTSRTTLDTGAEEVSTSSVVTTWHGGLKNAQDGLGRVNLRSCWEYNGIRTDTMVLAKILVPVVVMAKRPKIGDAVMTQPVTCPGCSGAGVLTDDPQVLKCESCGGIFTNPAEPIYRTAAWKFVALGQPMLANAGDDGQFYFDLNIIDGPDGFKATRVHGWADTKTRRVVQFG